jgi:hypothetical protein
MEKAFTESPQATTGADEVSEDAEPVMHLLWKFPLRANNWSRFVKEFEQVKPEKEISP